MITNLHNHPTEGGFGVVRTKSWIGGVIRLMTRSQVNHAFIIIRLDANGEDWTILEADPRGARYAKLSKYADLDVVFSVHKIDTITRARIVKEAKLLYGTPYNFLDIAALFFLMLGVRWQWLQNIAQNQNRLICSQLVDRAYENAGLHLYTDKRPDGEVTPGDLLMFLANGSEPTR